MTSPVEEDMNFIETELLPEMVHNRCFCESNSREFVELESVKIEPMKKYYHQLNFTLYRASVVIQFSGEPRTFYILIKLLPEESFPVLDSSLTLPYNGFLNEEILWNKATLQYGKDFFPKFYAADMGRYGRPVIVVEDLEKNGFTRVTDREFNEEEAKSIIELIGSFHGKGFLMKETKFSVFREFYAKFQEITLAIADEVPTSERLVGFIRSTLDTMVTDKNKLKDAEKLLDHDQYSLSKLNDDHGNSHTICQGLLLRENIWFKRTENNDGKLEVRVLDWQRVRYSSNSVDLTSILLQCQPDQWPDLIATYVSAVQKEQPALSKEELCSELTCPGLLYAVVILSIERSELREFSKFLPYFSK